MLTQVETTRTSGFAAKEFCHVAVTIIYQDASCFHRAKAVLRSIAIRLGPEYMLDQKAWQIDLLKLPNVGQLSLEDAVASDILVIAACPKHCGGFEAWLDR